MRPRYVVQAGTLFNSTLILNQFYLVIGIINLFGDICILSVPIQKVLKLQMGKTQKIAVCFMFLLGSLYVPPLPLPPPTLTSPPNPASASPPSTAS